MSRAKLELPKELQEKAIRDIQTYFLKERDEDLGYLSAMMILEFIVEKIGPSLYNQGLHDAISYFNEKTEELFGFER